MAWLDEEKTEREGLFICRVFPNQRPLWVQTGSS
jgi:hypothetical protein